jgi:CNT family concentrative nucleoside transporter
MRVLLVSHLYPPAHTAGTERYSAELARRLLDAGHEVRVFCSDKDVTRRDLSLRERIHDGVRVHELTNNLFFEDFRQTWDRPEIDRLFAGVCEDLIVMTAGFATIAGSVLVVYVTLLRETLPAVAAHLITVSIMSAPAAVALALTIVPETKEVSKGSSDTDFKYHSTMDAFATGASDGIAIIWNIATMLIAALALVYITNAVLGMIPVPPDWAPPGTPEGQVGKLSLNMILGWLFFPLMYMAGVPWEEAAAAGGFVGMKTVFTEFVAFINLGNLPAGEMTERTRTIVTYAICGFANFGSMGILIGGLSIMCPERRPDFLSLAWKTLFAGTLATITSATVIGSLPYSLFASVTR